MYHRAKNIILIFTWLLIAVEFSQDYIFLCLIISLFFIFSRLGLTEESTNDYLNQNWRPVSEALKPIISKTIEDILLDMMQKIFHQIPGDFFVTDLPTPDQLNSSWFKHLVT